MGTLIVWSETLGAVPCRIVGRNHNGFLVEAMGAIVPVDKAQVYELEPGYTVRNGKIVREDPTPVAKTVLTYVPEQGVSDG
jgi:hypothetical protein